MLMQVSLDDVRPYASLRAPDTDNNLIILDDFHDVTFSGKTLQLGFMLCCYCNRGSASFVLNGKAYEMKPGDFLVGFGEQVFEKCRPSEDFSGRIVLVSQDYCKESFVGLQNLWPFLLYLLQNPVIHLSEAEQIWLFDSFAALMRRLKNKSHGYRKEAILMLMRVFYFDVCDFLAKRNPEAMQHSAHSYVIFDKFINLAQACYTEHREVKWYANEMGLSSKYLSEIVKTVSGRTAGQWLMSLTLTQIKSLLRNTGLSIKEITARMHFPNQSFLGKYFKNATGISPSDYRNGKMKEA